MKKIIFIIMVFSFFVQSHAQVPGYLGKRLLIGYDAEIATSGIFGRFVTYNPITYHGDYASFFDLNIRQFMNLEYVVNRQSALNFSVGFSRNGLFSSGDESASSFMNAEYPGLLTDGYPFNKYFDYMNETQTMYKIGMTFSTGNYIAPQGKSVTLNFLINKSNIQYVKSGIAHDLTRITDYGFQIQKNNRRIIKDAFIINYGIGFGFLYGGWFGYDKNTIIHYHSTYQLTNLLLTFHIGVDYLVLHPGYR